MDEETPALIGFLRDDGRCQSRYVIRLITPEDKQTSHLFLYLPLSFSLYLSFSLHFRWNFRRQMFIFPCDSVIRKELLKYNKYIL